MNARRATIASMLLSVTTLGVAAWAAETAAVPDDAALIRDALSAGPAGMARSASVMTMGKDGSMWMLRKGTGGFTCMPDNPDTPGPDPMCWDRNADGWVHAYLGHTTPPAGKVGFIYMLRGGTDASNTDPYAAKPTAANHWIETGPHVMIVGADAAFYDQYPKGADPDTTVPYVMWAGTPYMHLMAPVK